MILPLMRKFLPGRTLFIGGTAGALFGGPIPLALRHEAETFKNTKFGKLLRDNFDPIEKIEFDKENALIRWGKAHGKILQMRLEDERKMLKLAEGLLETDKLPEETRSLIRSLAAQADKDFPQAQKAAKDTRTDGDVQ